MKSYVFDRVQFVKLFGMKSKSFKVLSGVPRGSRVGHLLFNTFMNSISSGFSAAKVLLFADDAKLLQTVLSLEDYQTLQRILLTFTICCDTVGFSLNITEPKVMSFYRTKNIIIIVWSPGHILMELIECKI